jgi:hypothetical protein
LRRHRNGRGAKSLSGKRFCDFVFVGVHIHVVMILSTRWRPHSCRLKSRELKNHSPAIQSSCIRNL